MAKKKPKVRKPRGKMPPPTRVFPDRKKEKSKKACRKAGPVRENDTQ